MPFYVVNGLSMHVNLGGRKGPPQCVAPVVRAGQSAKCCGISTFACDWPVGVGTCDAPLCTEHATQIGKNRHFCPKHLKQKTEEQPQLF